MAVVCTLQMMQTLQYSQSQQDDFAPSVFHIAVITRSMEIQIKVSPLQVEPYTLQVFLLPSCADLHFLLPLTYQELHLELHELVACSQQDHSKGYLLIMQLISAAKISSYNILISFKTNRCDFKLSD